MPNLNNNLNIMLSILFIVHINKKILMKFEKKKLRKRIVAFFFFFMFKGGGHIIHVFDRQRGG
jgi:hypothetical protein